jgi:HKD family nuclease
MTDFKNDKPQFQSITGSYQTFGEPTAKSIKCLLLGQKLKTCEINLFDMFIYIFSYVFIPFEKLDYWLKAFKNDKPQFQLFTRSYQAFGEPTAKSIKWL